MEEYRLTDPARGDFEPENKQPHGPMRPGKSAEDRMARDKRPRVEAAKKRAEKMKKTRKS